MILRTHRRRKYGKDHCYFSVVETAKRAGGNRVCIQAE